LGFRGLYIIPTLCLWLLWWRNIELLKYLRFSGISLVFSVFTLVLGMPILLYGAMFWEHTLAVLLVFIGLEYAIKENQYRYSIFISAVMGIAFGFAFWIRPEAFLVSFPVTLFLALRYYRKQKTSVIAFILAFCVTTFGFFIINLILYNYPLGIHGTQSVHSGGLGERLFRSIQIIKVLLFRLLMRTFPLAILIIALFPILWRNRKPSMYLLTFLTIFVILFVPIMVISPGGKQWGPRFLYIIFPLLILLAAYQMESIKLVKIRFIKYFGISAFVLLSLFGFYRNSFQGTINLIYDYNNRIQPSLLFLRQTQPKAVAVGHQVISQELFALHPDLNFFLTPDKESIEKLGVHLLAEGICEFYYMTGADYYYPPKNINGKTHAGFIKIYTFIDIGTYGEYNLYDVEVSPCNELSVGG
jgi:hypothetical protein